MNEHNDTFSQRVVSVRTPENIELSYALAGPGSRAAAYLIDIFMMFVAGQMLLNIAMAGFLVLLEAIGVESRQWVTAIAALATFGFYNTYFILFECLMAGQTPGKRFLHIRVVKQGGYALRFSDTLLRNLLRAVDFLPIFYGVGLTSLLLTRDSQRLGDLVAGTLVVYQEPVETGSLIPDLPPPDTAEVAFPAAQLLAVPSDLISLAAQYLRLRGELAPRPRQEVGAELVNFTRAISGLEPRPGQSVEGFLASVVRQVEQGRPSSLGIPAEAELPS
jgi:uncharacterized RDD family membrane protein YckC